MNKVDSYSLFLSRGAWQPAHASRMKLDRRLEKKGKEDSRRSHATTLEYRAMSIQTYDADTKRNKGSGCVLSWLSSHDVSKYKK